MSDSSNESSESDIDELNWSLQKRKILASRLSEKDSSIQQKSTVLETETIVRRNEKFEELRIKSADIKAHSARRIQIAEKRRSKKLLKKALKDPFIRELVETDKASVDDKNASEQKDKEEWDGVKPFLNVNSHLQGPVSHGIRGPKSELETIIDDAIQKGDFEKAELLSDTLANKDFAGKICKAFSAKRCHEQQEQQREIEKNQRKKKIRWMFDSKEKWQMKGNM